jgi:hypothetical protein
MILHTRPRKESQLNRDRESMLCPTKEPTAAGLGVSESDLEMSCYGNFIAFVKGT